MRKLYYLLSPTLRLLARRILYFPSDLLASREKLVPPKGLTFTGAGDFKSVGEKFFRKIVEDCQLTPQSSILDVGCGIGRMARPFTGYLDHGGVYHGFDIVPTGIEWCTKHYRQFENFHFHHVDVRNSLYNTGTVKAAADFSFPFINNSFDVAIAISVFTHMQENDVKRYLSEIARVLDNNKYCFCTFFIITTEREETIQSNNGLSFKHRYDNFFLHDNRVPDANVAFRLEPLKEMIRCAGLSIEKHLEGWWFDNSTRDRRFDFQDVLVLRKTV